MVRFLEEELKNFDGELHMRFCPPRGSEVSGVLGSFRVFVFGFSALLGFSGNEQEEASNH